MVALCFEKLLILSSSFLGVLPAGRVIITLCETSGIVSSASSALAVPNSELTPGIISYSMLSFFSSRICSPMAP